MIKKVLVFLVLFLVMVQFPLVSGKHNIVGDGGGLSGLLHGVFDITSWRTFSRTTGDWYETTGKLRVLFINQSDSLSKVALVLTCDQGSPKFADYMINMSVDGEYLNMTRNGYDITLVSHCLRVVFNYWDISRYGFVIDVGLSDGVFFMRVSRDRVRNGVYTYDPTFFVSGGEGDITAFPSARLLQADSSQKLHVIFNKVVSGGYDIYYCNSTDDGATWSTGKLIQAVSISYNNYGKALVVNRSNDDLYVVYAYRFGLSYFLKLASSRDGGLTWTYQHVNGSSYTRRKRNPVMCITYDNKLMVFFEYYNGGYKYEIQCRWYNFSNSSWSSHFLVSSTPTYNQYYPSCAVSSGSGNCWVVWDGNHGGSTTYYQCRAIKWSNTTKGFVYPVTNLTTGNYHSYQPCICSNWSGGTMRIAFYRSYTDDYQVRIINITDSDGALSNPCNVSAFKGYDNSEPSISVDQLDYTYVVWYVTVINYELRMRTYEPGVGWGAQDNMSFQETMTGNYYGVFLHGVKPKCYPYNGCMFVWTNSSNCYFYVSPGFEWDRVENYVPVLSGLFPGNNSWEISCYPKMNITATDRNGEGMTVNVWASNDSISWYCFASYVLGGNMTLHPVNEAFNESYTYYYWNVTVTDYVNTNSSGVYHFHTGNCTCTCIDEIIYMTIPGLRVINPNPGNGSHSKNYLKEDATGLTTSVDVSYENFTTPGAAIPGSYSITIPATSFTGGDILENSSSVYANVQANETGRVYTGNLYAGQGENAGVYCIDRSFLSFDTSVIPDVAVIDSAHIGLVVYSDLLVEEEYVVCLQSVKPPIPHNPLLCTDYNKHAFPSTATLSLKNTTGYNDGDDFNLTLNSTGLSEINKTTTTNWILRSMNDIKAWVPDVYEDICFCAPSYVIPGSRPVLVVNYTVPSSNWRHIVNLTWCSNSSGSWLPFYTSTVTGNGTVTVPAVNFSSNMSYFWNVSYESNDTNSGVTDVFVFEAVSCGSGSGAVVMVGGRPWLVWFILGGGLGLLIGMVLFVRRKKK